MTHETLNKILKYINENVYMDTQYAIYYINDDVDLIKGTSNNQLSRTLF